MAVGGAICYIPLSQFHKARLVRQLIENIPGNVQVENVAVSLLGDSIELDRLSGSVEFFQGMPFDLRVQKLRLEGVNWDLGKRGGAEKMADLIFAEHLNFSSGPAFSAMMGYSAATVSSYSINGLWLDWGLLQEAGAAGPRSQAFADMLLSLRLGAASVRDASLKITERSHTGEPVGEDYIIAVSRLETDRYSLLSTGKSKTWNYSQIYESGARFTAREISFSSRATPAGALRMALAGLFDRQNFNKASSLALLREGYSLRDLECKELLVVTAEGESLHIPSLFADADIGAGNLLLKIEAPDIWVSGSLMARALKEIDPRLAFLADRKLHLSTLVDWKTEPMESEGVRLLWHQELHETKLGSAVLHAVFSGQAAPDAERVLPFDPDGLAFESGLLELEDDDFLASFFSFDPNASPDDSDDPGRESEARRAAAEEIKSSQAAMPPFLKGVFGRFALFVEKSGFFSIQAKCGPPLLLRAAFDDPAELEKVSINAIYSQ